MNRWIKLLLLLAALCYIAEGLAITFHALDPLSPSAFQGAVIVAVGSIFSLVARDS